MNRKGLKLNFIKKLYIILFISLLLGQFSTSEQIHRSKYLKNLAGHWKAYFKAYLIPVKANIYAKKNHTYSAVIYVAGNKYNEISGKYEIIDGIKKVYKGKKLLVLWVNKSKKRTRPYWVFSNKKSV